MIDVYGLITLDEESYKVVRQHMNQGIILGVAFYLETYDSDKKFLDNSDFDENFPASLKTGRYEYLESINAKLLSDEIVILDNDEANTLVKCLRDFLIDAEYDESVDWVVAGCSSRDNCILATRDFPIEDIEIRDKVIISLVECIQSEGLQGEDETLYDVVKYYMNIFEDLCEYEDFFFEDLDFLTT